MSEKPRDPKEPKDLKDLMPTERKTMWRTAEERRMSDLTRVLEWLVRRKGKKKQPVQKQKLTVVEPPKTKMKEGKKIKEVLKRQEGSAKMKLLEQTTGQSSRRNTGSNLLYQSPYGGEQKRLSLFPGTYEKEVPKRSELNIKDAIALESTSCPSVFPDPSMQDNAFSSRRMTMIRDWSARTSDIAFERKLKSLMEKGTEPKIESMKMLKPEEVLSCRYLRLSKNNIRTLFKLCKDVGLNMDIHPHMTETEIDVQKVPRPGPKVPVTGESSPLKVITLGPERGRAGCQAPHTSQPLPPTLVAPAPLKRDRDLGGASKPGQQLPELKEPTEPCRPTPESPEPSCK